MKANYVEPDDYIPKEIRKKYGLGEYAKKETEEKKRKLNEDFRNYVNKK